MAPPVSPFVFAESQGELFWVACIHAPQMSAQVATGSGGRVRLDRIDASHAIQVIVVQGARAGRRGVESPSGRVEFFYPLSERT